MRLRVIQREFGERIAIVNRHFPLVPEERPRPAFTGYHLAHRKAAAEQDVDVPRFHLPREGDPYPRSSLPALEAAAWVQEAAPEKFDAFDLALFAAFFERTEDISDALVLSPLAESVGLNALSLREVLASRRYRERVLSDFIDATDQYGIHAIPSVVIPGGPPIVGAVPLPHYREAITQALTGLEDGPPRDPVTGKVILHRGTAYFD